jgi:hypothetical protein
MNLSPLPIQKFFDSNGAPLVSGRLFTYVVSTSTKLSTYKDQAGTLNTNPIVLDYRGEANVWLDQTLTYKFVLAPPGADDPPTNPIWTVDNISAAVTYASLTQQIVGQILYPKSAAETSAGVTIVNYFYPYLCVNRYGTNTTPLTTDMRGAWQAAINVAKDPAARSPGTHRAGRTSSPASSTARTQSVARTRATSSPAKAGPWRRRPTRLIRRTLSSRTLAPRASTARARSPCTSRT